MEDLVNNLRLEGAGKEDLVAFVKQLAALDTGAKVVAGSGGMSIKRHDGSMVSFSQKGTIVAWARMSSGTVDLDSDDAGEAMYDLINKWDK